MSRARDSWGALGAALARVLASGTPEWVSADTQHAAEVLLRRLARDARRVVARQGVDHAGGALGIGRASVVRGRAGGWLAEGEEHPRRTRGR